MSNHGVRKFWIYWTLCLLSYFVELHGTLFSVNYQIYQGLSIHLDGNSDKRDFFFKQGREIGELSGFLWNIPDISRIYPSQGTQAMLTQRQRKFELFYNPSQAKPHLRSSLRSTGKVQPYPVIA